MASLRRIVINMGTNAVQRDATAETVSANVKRLRKDQNLGLRGLATKLGEVGRPLGHSAVDQIEKGKRRVDVDDLMALAAALGVSPITLLMPETAGPDDVVEATGRKPDSAVTVWDWLRALQFRGFEDYQSLVASNPPWAFQSVMEVASMQRARRLIDAGISPTDAHVSGEIRRGDD